MLGIGRVLVVAVRVMIDGYVHPTSARAEQHDNETLQFSCKDSRCFRAVRCALRCAPTVRTPLCTPSGVEYLRIGRVRDSLTVAHSPLSILLMFLDWLLCCFKPRVSTERVDVDLATPITDRNPNPMPPSAPAGPSNSHRPNKSALSSGSGAVQRPSERRTPEMSMAPGQRAVTSSTNVVSSRMFSDHACESTYLTRQVDSEQVPQGAVRRDGAIPRPPMPSMAVASRDVGVPRNPHPFTDLDLDDSAGTTTTVTVKDNKRRLKGFEQSWKPGRNFFVTAHV